MQEFLPGVYRLHNRFVNLFLAKDADGFALFDTGLARSGPALVLDAIAVLGGQPSQLKRIFITHTDMDHTGGAAELKAKTGARLYASPVEAAAMAKGDTSRHVRGLPALFTKPFGVLFPTPDVPADEILVDEQLLPFLGGMKILFTPGHTPGHTSYYLPALGLLIAGDSLNASSGALAFKDAPVHWNYQTGKISVAKQAATGAKVIGCGHGGVILGGAFPVL